MLRGAAYIRVSTHEQIEFSPEAQKNAIYIYAEKNNIAIKPEFVFTDEGISGKKAEKRPAFMKMIKLAKEKLFDVILVHKFDRFARNREDSVVFKSLLRKECGIKVISITEQLEDDKFSIILESMLEAMAEYYSLNLADEVKKGMVEKAKRGGYLARPPLGYTIVESKKPPVIIPKEALIIRSIFEKFVNEDRTIHDITKYLNELGFRTSKGNRFEKRNIKYILHNPIYAGYTRWNYRKNNKINDESEWIIAKADHEPIISKEIYDKAVNKLKHISEIHGNKYRPSSEYGHWLSGVVKCAYCGGPMTLNGTGKYHYYVCNKYLKGSCQYSNRISLKRLESVILDKIYEDMNDLYFDVERIPETNKVLNLDVLNRQLIKIQNKYQLAKEAFLEEIDTLVEYKSNKESISKEEQSIKSQLNKLSLSSYSADEFIRYRKSNVYDILKDKTLSVIEKNRVLKSFVKNIVVDVSKGTVEINYYPYLY